MPGSATRACRWRRCSSRQPMAGQHSRWEHEMTTNPLVLKRRKYAAVRLSIERVPLALLPPTAADGVPAQQVQARAMSNLSGQLTTQVHVVVCSTLRPALGLCCDTCWDSPGAPDACRCCSSFCSWACRHMFRHVTQWISPCAAMQQISRASSTRRYLISSCAVSCCSSNLMVAPPVQFGVPSRILHAVRGICILIAFLG